MSTDESVLQAVFEDKNNFLVYSSVSVYFNIKSLLLIKTSLFLPSNDRTM